MAEGETNPPGWPAKAETEKHRHATPPPRPATRPDNSELKARIKQLRLDTISELEQCSGGAALACRVAVLGTCTTILKWMEE